ncbi:sodium-independent sulfate anion transporter-like [Pectinophora gossypiella]|uniref:sodium-independent sulfate anion transporter-like n=1 Tax=Pectinophora gossypiella TaxID=13191 RepID=UPI00214E2420|nr:sodium-independent sulfate anion transporter-like [Pectinophora gossypiella]
MNIANQVSDHDTVWKKIKKCTRSTCSVKTVKKRLPIVQWLPKYNFTFLIQDIIAGVTVGLTAIPQGIAYAVVAGLSPEYGLYAGLMGGFIYLIFGSCKDVTVGPTAIMSALTAKYVSGYSSDFAVLAAFLSGVVALAMGILHLGFLLEFISQPVITGFTTAAALQIASAQLKSLLGLAGSSGNYFAESITNFVVNIKTAKLWDSFLGFSTIIVLFLLQRLGKGCGRTDGLLKQLRWFVSLARNAVVVIIGIIIAYILKLNLDSEPLTLIGEIGSGLPTIKPPPFTTVVGNETYTFNDMLSVLGLQSVVLPLVAILESVAIAKAFAGGVIVDATQEMIALGFCNIIGSFASSMPVTGSFTRTALNHASGVQTTAGGIVTGLLIILALSLLTSTFYFIPKATLAGLIITAMFSMINYTIFGRLWKDSKKELVVIVITIGICLYLGLEYGIVTGIAVEAAMLLFTTSRPKVDADLVKSDKGDVIVIMLSDSVSYCAAEHVRRAILKASNDADTNTLIVVDGTNLRSMDTTVASNLMSVVQDVHKKDVKIKFLNFKPHLIDMCANLNAKSLEIFEEASNAIELLNRITKSVCIRI